MTKIPTIEEYERLEPKTRRKITQASIKEGDSIKTDFTDLKKVLGNMDNFRELYNKELEHYEYESTLVNNILNSSYIRAFVYEVCKACVASIKDIV